MAGSWVLAAWSMSSLACGGAHASRPLQPTEPAAGLAMPDAHLVSASGASLAPEPPLVFVAKQGSPCGKKLVCVAGDRIVFAEPLEFEPEVATPVRRANLIFQALVELLEAHPEIRRVLVAGHFAGGPEDDNQVKSERRAKRVMTELTLRGVRKSRIHATGFGSAQPLVEGSTPEAIARNSRVELIIEETTP